MYRATFEEWCEQVNCDPDDDANWRVYKQTQAQQSQYKKEDEVLREKALERGITLEELKRELKIKKDALNEQLAKETAESKAQSSSTWTTGLFLKALEKAERNTDSSNPDVTTGKVNRVTLFSKLNGRDPMAIREYFKLIDGKKTAALLNGVPYFPSDFAHE